MRAAAILLALALATATAPVRGQVLEGVPSVLPSEDGYDIDRILRRARELDARPRDDRVYRAWEARQDRIRREARDAGAAREQLARQRYEAERSRQMLDAARPRSSTSPSDGPLLGDRLRDAETLTRLRIDAERARREADDQVPLMWRERR
jgi:hypothetical protein